MYKNCSITKDIYKCGLFFNQKEPTPFENKNISYFQFDIKYLINISKTLENWSMILMMYFVFFNEKSWEVNF